MLHPPAPPPRRMRIRLRSPHCVVRAVLAADGTVTVAAGSTAVATARRISTLAYRDRRASLLADGTLVPDMPAAPGAPVTHLRVTRRTRFANASEAAIVLLGVQVNGRHAWTADDGTPLTLAGTREYTLAGRGASLARRLVALADDLPPTDPLSAQWRAVLLDHAARLRVGAAPPTPRRARRPRSDQADDA